jgi:hypothetical protein
MVIDASSKFPSEEINEELRVKSSCLEILFTPRDFSVKVLKKFQSDVPSITAWFTKQPMKTPSASSVTYTAKMG